jgi:hypothetical protein
VELVFCNLHQGMEIRPADLIFDPTLACCGLAAFCHATVSGLVRDI